MHPVLFELSLIGREVTVKSYTFFLVLAAICVVGLGTLIARKRGLSPGASALSLVAGLVVTLIAARLVHWLTNPSSFADEEASVLSLGRSNLSVFAGMLVGVPVAAVVGRRLGLNVWRLGDSAAPALALAAVLARIGCFLNGCCFGDATGVPWGIGCPPGSAEHLAQVFNGDIGLFDGPLPVHPTQLYDAAAAMLGGLVALWLLRRKSIDGAAFLAFVVCYVSLRWSIHHLLRSPSSFVAPEWLYPALYMVVVVMCSAAVTLKCRKSARQE